MILNSASPVSTASRPRGMVVINGERAGGLVSFEVDNNSYFQADTFRLTLALSAQAVDRDFSYWAAQTTLQVELLVGNPPNPDNFTKSDLVSWLVGYVDDIQIDPLRDEITMSGRDLTSLLIDTKRSEAFTNVRSSDIATQIATAVGLTPNVTATKAFTGTMNEIVKKLANDRATYWDLLTKLAQIEQYDVYVKGKTLNFTPKAAVKDTYLLQYQAPGLNAFPALNGMTMNFSRNLSVARGVKVTVMAWNQMTGKVVTVTATRARTKNKTVGKLGSTSLPPAEYFRQYPNMTADQAQAKANALVAEISQHEVNVDADFPGDDLLTPRVAVQVQGTGTAFDQIYYPASVTRRYSFDEGYRMSLHARNTSPETQLS